MSTFWARGGTFEQRPAGHEREGHVMIWGRNVVGKSTCPGPEMGMCLMCSGKDDESVWLEEDKKRNNEVGHAVTDESKSQIIKGLETK